MFVNKGIYDDDLFQDGVVALIIAIDKFDPSKGYELSTYATKCIAGQIRTAKKKNNIIRPIRRDKRVVFADIVSMETPISIDGDGYDLLLIDALSNDVDVGKEAVDNIMAKEFIDSLDKCNQNIIIARMYKCSVKEQREIVGLSHEGIRRRRKKIKAKYLYYTRND